MHRLEIEWRHLDKEGNTCDRCSDTGKTVQQALEVLSRELKPAGWEVSFKETRLTEKEIAESNAILLNGIPLEDILPKTRKSENSCVSCCELLGTPTLCRTIIHDGRTYEAIPTELIREAACLLVHKQTK